MDRTFTIKHNLSQSLIDQQEHETRNEEQIETGAFTNTWNTRL